jgi:hypothetical protein
MEPITTGIVKAGAKEVTSELKKESDGFLKAIYGEPAKALGGLFADKINKRRHHNLITITAEAKRKLKDAGVSPKEVPLSIIHPALEAASLEEHPDLQQTWANLLGNAADPRQSKLTSPSFPIMLRELRSKDVRFLSRLYEIILGQIAEFGKVAIIRSVQDCHYSEYELLGMYIGQFETFEPQPHRHRLDLDDITKEQRNEFLFSVDVLRRHGIIEEFVYIPPTKLERDNRIRTRLTVKDSFPQSAAALAYKPDIRIDVKKSYFLTHLGECFITACRKPEPDAPAGA